MLKQNYAFAHAKTHAIVTNQTWVAYQQTMAVTASTRKVQDIKFKFSVVYIHSHRDQKDF